MGTRWITVLALAIALAWSMPSFAQDHGHGHDKDKGNPHADKARDHDDGRWEMRDGYEYRTYGREEGTPPGWSKGKKTGWGNCGLPPGQAKKYGCRSYLYNGRTHYYYRDEQGRIIVRRHAEPEHEHH